MMLTAYAQASEPGTLQFWVGIFGTEQAPMPQFQIDGAPSNPIEAATMNPIRDFKVGPGGKPLNHQGVFRHAVAKEARPHQVRINAGGEHYELPTASLPQSIPQLLDSSFNILLCSCYFQPEDKQGLLGTIISQIQLRPQLTVMAGDQVYLDLPFEGLPQTAPELSSIFGDKYLHNWASTGLDTPGLQTALGRAPVVCVPDDHEFWNNYPFSQKQLPGTWNAGMRQHWADAAQALYEDYQIGGIAGSRGATRINIDPLKMLFVDMRCHRDDQFQKLMAETASDALTKWVNDLIAAKAQSQPAIGVLSSGQVLFIDSPKNDWIKRNVDAEMANYAQFDIVQNAIEKLADNHIPVVYLTGDVHWGRVGLGTDLQTDTPLYEIISSPSRLIRTPFLDTAKESVKLIKGIFGPKDPWPRHSDPPDVPDRFGRNRRFALSTQFKRRGDQVVIVSFNRAGNGVDMQVSYYGIHPDKSISKSETTGPFKLRVR